MCLLQTTLNIKFIDKRFAGMTTNIISCFEIRNRSHVYNQQIKLFCFGHREFGLYTKETYGWPLCSGYIYKSKAVSHRKFEVRNEFMV